MTDLKHQIEASLARFKGKDLKHPANATLMQIGANPIESLNTAALVASARDSP